MSHQSNKANSYLKGATILAAAGILSRLLGLFYKVPLYRLVGSYGNGIYGNVTNIYNMLLMVSTVGIPVAISKMISESTAVDDYRGAKDVFKVSAATLLVLGGLSTIFLLLCSHWIIHVANWPEESYPSMMAIALAPFIISICSAFRGFFQGFQIMTPTAVSQIIEQIIRVGLGILLCWMAMSGGQGVGMGVGGAILGATVGGMVAAIFLGVIFWAYTSKNQARLAFTRRRHPRSWKTILKRLLIIAVPVTLTSVIVSLFATINSFIYVSRLAVAGIDKVTATMMFGDYTNVDTLINIPLVISANLAVAMIPAISESFALHDKAMMNSKIDLAIRIVVMVALPCCVGLSVLSYGIFDLLFPGSLYGPGMMEVFAYATIFMMLSNIFQSILQSIDKFRVPLFTLGFGTVIFFITGWITMAIPSINIYGMGLAFMVTFVYLTIANYSCVKKFTGVRINWMKTVIKPVISAAIMGVVTWAVYNGLHHFVGNVISLVVTVLVAAVVYTFVMIFTGAITHEELMILPGHHRIEPAYHRIVRLRRKLFKR